ncbi:hypothetical protein KKF84_22070 [Myxococcota bacterium]|nr:hypothetical protein [Myxococcota bacterium]
MLCPGCGNSLSHKDLQRKRCGGCDYILPVIIQKERVEGAAPPRRQTLNPALPPPKRKPLSLEMDAMSQTDEFQAGEVFAVQVIDEPNITREPSMTTDEDHGIILPHPPPPPAVEQVKRVPRGAKKSQFDKTIKVNMRELPNVDEIRRQNKKKFVEDLILIVFIIISFLALTAILIMYLK